MIIHLYEILRTIKIYKKENKCSAFWTGRIGFFKVQQNLLKLSQEMAFTWLLKTKTCSCFLLTGLFFLYILPPYFCYRWMIICHYLQDSPPLLHWFIEQFNEHASFVVVIFVQKHKKTKTTSRFRLKNAWNIFG